MDVIRIGRVIRAIRMHKGWRQVDLAERAHVSQSLIARIERGGAGRLRLDTLARVAAALDARSFLRIDWQGEAADRLLDADHAGLVEHVLILLRRAGWEVAPEVTYAIGAERGSVDVLAWDPATSTALVIEAKTVVPDVQAMLATFDRKVRHAEQIARTRGWRPVRIAQMLVIAESRTSRRRVDAHRTTFVARFPHGATDARRFVAHPAAWPADWPTLRALWFLPARTRATSRQRVAKRRFHA